MRSATLFLLGPMRGSCDGGGKMVVWLFGILWISYFLMHLEAVSTQEIHLKVRSAALYAGLSDRQQNGDFEAILTGKPRLGLAEAVDKAGNNAEGNGTRVQQKLFGQTASATKLSANANIETSNKENDLPDTYVLVVNIAVGSKDLTLPRQKSLTDVISRGLKFEHSGCFVLHIVPISRHRVQVNIYCKKKMTELLSSDQDTNEIIPAESLARSLNRPDMQHVLKNLNVTAFGVRETPPLELAIYQEMWFPVAVVAGVSILLVIMAVVCLLLCRRKLDVGEEEKTKVDPELLYPSVRPMNTVSARMVQPGATRDYIISGAPAKPKWKGSQLSLSDRRGSKASLFLDLRSSSTDLASTSPAPSIIESPTEERLASKSLPLSFSELEDCVQSTKQLYAEFWDLPMNHPPAQDRDQIPGSSYRNRYPFILPNTRSRVKLAEIPGDSLSTYINANFIKGYGGVPQAYIATQGPMTVTLNDFWRMIWQYHCPVIVMITKLKERKETKCERYWPDPTFRMQEKYGDMVVTFDSAIGRDGYQITSLIISHSQSLEAPRRVYHYWYTAWPDHGVPDSPRQLLRLTEEVRKARGRDDVKGKPVVVHCSAGVGRTGCFIATSIGMQQISKEDRVNILKIVSVMRIDRGGMVETDDQYEFVYRTLHHYWRELRSGRGHVQEGRDVVLEAIFDDED